MSVLQDPVKKRKLIFALAGAATVLSVVLDSFFSDEDKKSSKKVRKEYLKHMKNNPTINERPAAESLEARIDITDMLKDPNRNYCKVLTSLDGFEFISLADYLKPFIEKSRNDHSKPMGNKMKFDHYNRLYFVLFWLATGLEYRQMEFFFGWSKTSIQKEIKHILLAIIEGLDHFMQWPNENERAAMASTYDGIMKNCIGIIDATEQPCRKSKNKNIETATYSGKQAHNTLVKMTLIYLL